MALRFRALFHYLDRTTACDLETRGLSLTVCKWLATSIDVLEQEITAAPTAFYYHTAFEVSIDVLAVLK